MLIKTECYHCKKEFGCQKRKYNYNIKKGYKLYCTNECSSLAKIKSVIKKCNECGKEISKTPSTIKKSKTGHVYCDRSCATKSNNKLFRQGKNHPNYNKGEGSYRQKKLRECINKCERCGYDECLYILQVHHKDCNRKNNELNNLELLCPNCHSLDHFLNKTGKYMNSQSEV